MQQEPDQEPQTQATERPSSGENIAFKTDSSSGERTFAILAVNDIYRIAGLLPSEAGGLSRIRTLRKELERDYPDLLFLHAGDALFPSLLSREFDGAQMIDVLNLMDGRDDVFDNRMIAVLGNHEFDNDDPGEERGFRDRMLQSDFRWLHTNISLENKREIKKGSRTVRVLSKVNTQGLDDVLVKTVLITTGGVRVGIFGLTRQVDAAYAKSNDSDRELEKLAATTTAALRKAGAEVVIGLTHLLMRQDRLICGRNDQGPDLIIGGHDHDRQIYQNLRCNIFKADADGLTASVVKVTVGQRGKIAIDYDFEQIGPGFQRPDPDVHARVNTWLARHERIFCRKLDRNPRRYCLDERMAKLPENLAGEEIRIRSGDTNLGRWVASLLLKAGQDFINGPSNRTIPKAAPTIAFINSGALRLNQTLKKGSYLLRRHIEELIAYDDKVRVVPISKKDLKIALERSGTCRTDGPWLQVAGLTYTVDKSTGTVSNIQIGRLPWSSVPDTVYAVTIDFLITHHKRDGYEFPGKNAISVTKTGKDRRLKELIWESLPATPNDDLNTPTDALVTLGGRDGTPACP